MTDFPPLDQIGLIGALVDHLGEEYGILHVLPRHMNAIVDAANHIVAEFAKPYRPVVDGMGAWAWLVGTDETGASSKWMLHYLKEVEQEPGMYACPHDADDFGRCLGLLRACPELRPLIPQMASAGPEWAALVGQWAELESWYNSETDPRPVTTARIRELLTEKAKVNQ